MTSATAVSPTRSPGRTWLAVVLVAIVTLALNLRLSVNAFGALLPAMRAELGLSASVAGVLNALPELVFAVAGIAAPPAVARLGAHRLIAVALALSAAGQGLRAEAGGLPTLLAGSLLTLVGIALGNVVLPGVIRQYFPGHITMVTSVYVTVLSLGATVGSGLTIPYEHAVGGTWRSGLWLWAVVCAVALVPWVASALRFRGDGSVVRRSSVPLVSLLRHELPWTLAGFFAIQAAHIYVVVGWLGQVLLDSGVGEVRMGALLAVPPFVAIGLSLSVPVLLRRPSLGFPLVVLFAGCYLLAYLGLIVAPAGGAWVWMALIGLGGGTFPLVLTTIALRATTPDGVIALSAFSQCVGYLLASLAPLLFGFLHDLGGSWTPSLIFMCVTLAPLVLFGLRVSRPRSLEEVLASSR